MIGRVRRGVLRSRAIEFGLLFLVGLIAAAGFLSVSLATGRSLQPSIVLAGAALFVFLVLWLGIWGFAPRADPLFLPVAALLSLLGLLMVYRLRPDLAPFQIAWIGIGVVAALATLAFVRESAALGRYKYTAALAGLILLLLPIFFGHTVGGARLWLRIAGLSFQPSEIGKVLLVVFLAAYLEEKRELLSISTRRWGPLWIPEPKHLGPLITTWVVSLVILVFERDIGTSLLFFGFFLAMVYIATGRAAYVGLGSVLFMAGVVAAYFIVPHVQTRVDLWLDPWQDISGRGYQIVQSLFAFGSGGVLGAGLGFGRPFYIPAAHTDFIFAAIGEELGLTGAVGVLLAYLLFTARGLVIAERARNDFSRLLASGLALIIALQALVIVGGVTRLIPLTGVTLPLMSYGGSSILANFVLLALLLRVSDEEAARA